VRICFLNKGYGAGILATELADLVYLLPDLVASITLNDVIKGFTELWVVCSHSAFEA
jgi:hypothetical protein